jgi:hypothetical protein
MHLIYKLVRKTYSLGSRAPHVLSAPKKSAVLALEKGLYHKIMNNPFFFKL